MLPAKNWPLIRTAYLQGEGSLRVLAGRFGVSEHTLEKRAAREGWRKQMATLCGKVAAVAEQTAERRGVKIGELAAAFVERTLNESGSFLDRIQGELSAAERGDPAAIRTLVLAWRDVVNVTRTTYRLDEKPDAVPSLVLLNVVGFPPPVEVAILNAETRENAGESGCGCYAKVLCESSAERVTP